MVRRLAVVAAIVAGVLWMHPVAVDHHDGGDQGPVAAHGVQCGVIGLCLAAIVATRRITLGRFRRSSALRPDDRPARPASRVEVVRRPDRPPGPVELCMLTC